jgi:hypothetical protein
MIDVVIAGMFTRGGVLAGGLVSHANARVGHRQKKMKRDVGDRAFRPRFSSKSE